MILKIQCCKCQSVLEKNVKRGYYLPDILAESGWQSIPGGHVCNKCKVVTPARKARHPGGKTELSLSACADLLQHDTQPGS